MQIIIGNKQIIINKCLTCKCMPQWQGIRGYVSNLYCSENYATVVKVLKPQGISLVAREIN